MNIQAVTELKAALVELDSLIESVKYRCVEQGIAPYEAVDHTGKPVLADLLIAKTNALAVIAHG